VMLANVQEGSGSEIMYSKGFSSLYALRSLSLFLFLLG
jgi:hypothetical protein